MSPSVEITFEGSPIAARIGESVAAALTAAGVRAFRTTFSDSERGVFCGMGVCQDCLVDVDGRPNQRACMTKVTGPHVVSREVHGRPLPHSGLAAAPIAIEDVEIERPEILVIGAGPGGLSAAIAARQAGADVLVVDERSAPGGQYFKQLAVSGADILPGDRQHREGEKLIQRARDLGIRIRGETMVWGAFEPQEFAAQSLEGTRRFLPRCTIIATGAYERGWAVPGWTSPGVMTTGAAQTFWRTSRRLPGGRVLIAGNGPLNLQLAAELIEGGAEVAAVVEAAERPGIRSLGSIAALFAASPSLVLDGMRYHGWRIRGRTPILHAMAVTKIEPRSRSLVVSVESATGGDARSFEVDVLCLGYGFEPSNELLRAIGCRHDFDHVLRQFVTWRDKHGRTDVAGVFALGDCANFGGSRAAMAEGLIAGVAAAADLGHAASPELSRKLPRILRDLVRHRRFQRALWRIYATTIENPASSPDALICRCEEVALSAIEEAMAEGLSRIGDIKRRTRAGMGLCQGRYCGPALQALIAQRFGSTRDEFSGFAPRLPVKPISIADLVRLAPK